MTIINPGLVPLCFLVLFESQDGTGTSENNSNASTHLVNTSTIPHSHVASECANTQMKTLTSPPTLKNTSFYNQEFKHLQMSPVFLCCLFPHPFKPPHGKRHVSFRRAGQTGRWAFNRPHGGAVELRQLSDHVLLRPSASPPPPQRRRRVSSRRYVEFIKAIPFIILLMLVAGVLSV